jgi:hypothetical protein
MALIFNSYITYFIKTLIIQYFQNAKVNSSLNINKSSIQPFTYTENISPN